MYFCIKQQKSMTTAFITIRFLDIIDILLVAFLMYRIYLWIRGTVALNIFIAIFVIYLFWLLVRALNMELISSILGQIIGVGVIALIIVFQQEIRRFLLMVGSRYLSNQNFTLENFFPIQFRKSPRLNVESIVDTCYILAKAKTGALIVLAKKSDMQPFAKTGDVLNADYAGRLIESIFQKRSPLHDGAVIIKGTKILAARCVLPITEKLDISPRYGMRHKAAIGMTENTDSIVIVISEERGTVSYSKNGEIYSEVSPEELLNFLKKEFPKKAE